MSKRTRDGLLAAAKDAERRANIARAQAAIERADYAAETETDKQDRIVDRLLAVLADNREGLPRGKLLRRFSSRNRKRAAEVLDNLIGSGELVTIQAVGAGSPGVLVSLPPKL
ncbi:hypothetical protein A5788_04575 [Gordonia sp. 852002-50816_SCH5313054-c]|uniref:hypothetical protein n=1 Tax=unclassified Gordonia (in: high G+C Gram-positive bacteria) TaxID=2657482 RepID=UPI0007EB47A1|nr:MULTISPECIES: hypothetical protein [unclassified Gordonia (in: high G+C Gram-positive bacteria)]OBC05884.1 hypothetical protein A5786_10780 [Gordonia sp. 852002-50816_SCH5313054-a]OBC21137.1 hypothetical protein A5788_04575 [Gordonia sp. 852002-50816_SCH5313054-c]